MSRTDYTIELEALKDALHRLNQEELDLNHAMQTYQQGLKHHEHCVSTLTKLEQSMDKSAHNVDVQHVEPIELSLKDVFTSLEGIEQSIEELPESSLESCIELLVQAEHILSAGYRQIDLAAATLHDATNNNSHPIVSSPSTEEVHRV